MGTGCMILVSGCQWCFDCSVTPTRAHLLQIMDAGVARDLSNAEVYRAFSDEPLRHRVEDTRWLF